jgi:hypothetical protein
VDVGFAALDWFEGNEGVVVLDREAAEYVVAEAVRWFEDGDLLSACDRPDGIGADRADAIGWGRAFGFQIGFEVRAPVLPGRDIGDDVPDRFGRRA